jgi:Spy/CpxP family protein refolding chaperone
MKNWKVIAGIVGVFLLGMTAGGLVTARVIKRQAHRAGAPGSPMAAEFITRRLTWELHLTPEQRRQVFAILSETQRELRPLYQRALTESQQKIRAVLRPDQQAKYDRLLAERRAARRPGTMVDKPDDRP